MKNDCAIFLHVYVPDGENCNEEDSDDSAESSLIKNIGRNDAKVNLKKLTVNELLKNATLNNNFKVLINFGELYIPINTIFITLLISRT